MDFLFVLMIGIVIVIGSSITYQIGYHQGYDKGKGENLDEIDDLHGRYELLERKLVKSDFETSLRNTKGWW